MRGLTHRWIVSTLPALEGASLGEALLAARAGGDERRRRILAEPSFRDLHRPDTLPGASAAGEALARALRGKRRIAIYGDYDVDGITASAILWHALRTLDPAAMVQTFVPHRMEHGYGLNEDALRELSAAGVETVVTVDCGVTAVRQAELAAELGLELIITDHHERTPQRDGSLPALPRAAAIAHPDLGTAPFRSLCGAAVAWKMACRLAVAWCGSERVAAAVQRILVDMVPLVALATVADVMPLEDENRIFVAVGLKALPTSPLPGIQALLAQSSLLRDVDSESVGFRLAPLLNACGRLGHAAEAVELLTTADARRATEIARTLVRINEERKRLEQECAVAAIRRVESEGLDAPERRAIVLADPGWHEGVVGVVCSRLVERFGRPTILLQEKGETCKGSGRSVVEVHLLECLHACGGIDFIRCGGHAMAAGLEIRRDQLAAFTDALVNAVNERLAAGNLLPTLAVDGTARLEHLSLATVKAMKQLEPFGRGNPRPRFLIEKAQLCAEPKVFGKTGSHLELYIRQGRARDSNRAVWWGAAERAPKLKVGVAIDLVVEPREDAYRGGVVFHQVCDIRPCDA